MQEKTEEKKTRLVKCVVVSDKMMKSRVGSVEYRVKHPRVGKYIKRTTRLMFHDEKNETKIGDEVLIKETRPMSARKTFKLVEVVKSAE